jgi:hypothetical protein
MAMALEQAAVFFAVFLFWLIRFLEEQDRLADVDRPFEAT